MGSRGRSSEPAPRGKRVSRERTPSRRPADALRGAPSGRHPRRLRALLVPSAIALLTLVAFWPALRAGFTNWDDGAYVTDNYLIRDLSSRGLVRIFSTPVEGNYHPLTMLSLALDFEAWRLRPFGYHLTGVWLHLLATLSVFWFVLLLSRSRATAAFVALFFGVHPLHVESVAWISARKDVLYALFYLLACTSYVAWVRGTPRRTLFYAGALVLFLLSLLSKGMAVTLPVALLLIDSYLERRVTLRQTMLEKAPFLALALGFGIAAVVVQKATGAIAATPPYPLYGRLLVACHGVVAYVVAAVFPVGLSAFYPYPLGGRIPAAFYAAPLIVAGLVLCVFALRRLSKGVTFGASFFLLNVVLVLQIVPVGSAIIADRYTYLSYVGVGFALAGCWRLVAQRPWARSALARGLGGAALVLILAGLMAATRARCEVWQSSASLWADVVRKYPTAQVAYKNLALVEKDAGRVDAALAHLERALALDPRDAEALCNRGNLYMTKGQYLRARADLDSAVRLDGRSPFAHNDLGAVYFYLQRPDRALAEFDTALRLKDAFPQAHLNRANLLNLLKQHARALADYDAYLAMEPRNPLAYYWRGTARRESGDREGAIADYDQAIRLAPGLADAFFARSQALEARGDLPAALRDALQARALGRAVDEGYVARLRGPRP